MSDPLLPETTPLPLPAPPEDPALRQALVDVIRAQRLTEAFYRRARALLREVEVALLQAEPVLQLVPTPGYDIYSPTLLSLHQPEGWLRRYLALFFAEPHVLPPHQLVPDQPLKLVYLLLNLDPQSVVEAELDLVLLHDCTGLTGSLPTWIEAIWNRGQFDLAVPPDGWYGRPTPIDLGYGASARLQLHRVPLHRLTDHARLQEEVVTRLLDRYRQIA